jgi:hypothetical protein
VTLNLKDSPINTAVKVQNCMEYVLALICAQALLCIALVQTYMVQFYPAIRIIEGQVLP